MKLPRLVPPADLLQQVDGVEAGLRRGHRLGVVGWGSFLISAVTVTASVIRSDFWKPGAEIDWSNWPFALPVLALLLSLLLINWTRFWIKASKEPFRYTCSIGPFVPTVAAATNDSSPPANGEANEAKEAKEPAVSGASDPKVAWLVQDLSERLTRRIGRLSLLDERYSGTIQAPESHIHIGGSYGIRENAAGEKVIEVLPWVRLGPPGSPAAVAHLVRFNLHPEEELKPESYEKLLERIYFSVATRLYRQIRSDVQKKIELLPKRYFRASANFYEAEDYAHSNTLDAYEAARDLYAEVIRLYDSSWWTFSETSAVRRALQRFVALRVQWTLGWRRTFAPVWPRLAKTELMVARAEIGYANMLLRRRGLAGQSGQRVNPIYEALPVAKRAHDRLEGLPPDAPGWRESVFHALVTLGEAHVLLGSKAPAEAVLRVAQGLDPRRAEQDVSYLHVKGLLRNPRRALPDLRRAVELDPSFEGAQFDLAIALEMLWRGRTTLEPDVAETVRDEYERVLKLNPGNISAWANLGYMGWLLSDGTRDDLEKVKRDFERGREYKEIQRETFVWELDYGLARIAAELGEFEEAYRRFIDAMAAHFAQGVSHDPARYTTYHFTRLTRAIVKRFEDYKERVGAEWGKRADGTDGDASPSHRVRDAVYAFALNDYAEACFNYFLRSGNRQFLDRARETLVVAERDLDVRFPMIQYNLHRIQSWKRDPEASDSAGGFINTVVELQPDWPDGLLEMALWYGGLAGRKREAAKRHDIEFRHLLNKEKALRHQADAKRKRAFDDRFGSRGRPSDIWSAAYGTVESPAAESDNSWQRLPLVVPEPEVPRPLTTSPAESKIVLQQVSSEVAELASQARKREELVDAENTQAKELGQQAEAIAAGLLPHAWLWQPADAADGDPASKSKEFDRRAIRRSDYRRARKWEREFDDLHVRAFSIWCRLQLESPSAERVELLEFLRARFLPDDFDLLDELCELASDKKMRSEAKQGLRGVVRGWIDEDYSWQALRWVIPSKGLFSKEEAREVLDRVAGTPQALPESLSIWLGTELDELGATERASSCYRRAAGSRDPAVLFDLGKRLATRGKSGDLENALDTYTRAAEIDDSAPHRSRKKSEYSLEIGRVLWQLGHHDKAVAEFSAVDGGSELPDGWRDALIDELIAARNIETESHYRILKNWLGRVLTTSRHDAEIRRDSAAALLRLALQRYHPLVRRRAGPMIGAELVDQMASNVPPVVLEADESFFPEDRETPQARRMLDPGGDLEKMSAAVLERTGVEVPAVQILSTSGLGEGRYRILIEGVALATGTLGEENVFCPDKETCERQGLRGREAPNPLDESKGLWLLPGQKPPARVAAWDRYTYIVKHLESVVARNGDVLFGIQQLEQLLEREGISEPALDEPGARLRLTGVVQKLLREGVPIADLRPIVDAFVEANETVDELAELVEAVRAAVASRLPAADPDRRLVTLDPGTEDRLARWIHVRNGKRFLALPADEAEELYAGLRDRFDQELIASLAVVVRSRGLRPYARRLIKSVEPGLAVVALGEVPEERRLIRS